MLGVKEFIRPSAVIAAVVAALASGPVAPRTADAGFSNPNFNPPIIGVPLGTDKKPPEGKELEELAKHEPFKSLPDNTARLKRLGEIRQRFRESIAAVKEEDPEVAACLQKLYDDRKICLEFSTRKIGGALKPDGATKCGSDRLNIVRFPHDPAPRNVTIYDLEGFRLVNTLAHEGRHGIQDTPHDERGKLTRAQFRYREVCLELETTKEEIKRMEEFIRVFEHIARNLELPKDAKGVGKALGRQLIADDWGRPQTRSIARSIVKQVKALLEGTKKVRDGYEAKKKDLERQISFAGPEDATFQDTRTARFTTIENHGESESWVISGGLGGYVGDVWTEDPRVEQHVFHDDLDTPPTMIEVSFPPEIDRVTDIVRWNGSVIAAGDDLDMGTAKLFSIGLADGRLEPGSLTELVATPVGHTGLCFNSRHEGTEHLCSMDADRNILIFEDQDPAGGLPGLPDACTHAGAFWPAREPPVGEFWVNLEHTFAYLEKTFRNHWYPGSTVQVAVRDEVSGLFSGEPEFDLLGTSEFAPGFGSTPAPGDSFIHVNCRPDRELEVTATAPGGDPFLLGTGCSSRGGAAIVALDTPVPPDPAIEIRIFDVDSGTASEPVVPVVPPAQPHIRILPTGPASDSDRGFQVHVHGKRFHDVHFWLADNLDFDAPPVEDGLGFRVDRTSDGGGSGWFSSEEVTGRDKFMRGALDPPPPPKAGSPPVTIFPASENEIDLRTPSTPPGSAYELIEGPPPFTGNFCWAGDGTFTYTPTDFAAGFPLTYSISVPGSVDPALFTTDVVVSDESIPPIEIPGTGIILIDCLDLGRLIPDLIAAGTLDPGYAGRFFPVMNQFRQTNNPADLGCDMEGDLHAHWHGFGANPVLPIAPYRTPVVLTGFPDPAPPNCGFGKTAEVPRHFVPVSVEEWERFQSPGG